MGVIKLSTEDDRHLRDQDEAGKAKEAMPENTVISHYRIISLLGAGGMGEVYLAEDTRLGRRVALKILPVEQTEDDRLRRFEQEARAASALNHPNIITIHEVGAARDVRFIAMEYIEGETLRTYLKRNRMTVRESIDAAIQIASALAAAHRVGIIHRDIKPENIMLRPDGYIKVLDFGIVKLTERFAEQALAESPDTTTIPLVHTDATVVMGSPNYMSPEQARGLEVDGRTDIFSFGAVLYEMITGRMPFDSRNISEVIVSILERQPPPMSELVAEVSPRLQSLVERAMAKDREARYQTINELLQDLRKQKQRLDIETGIDESISPDWQVDTKASVTGEDNRATVKEVAIGSSPVEAARDTSKETSVIGSVNVRKGGRLLVAAVIAVVIMAAGLILFFSKGKTTPPVTEPPAEQKAARPAINSIAVLPFMNVSGNPDSEYLSDGITESLINNLSHSPSLKVMSRNSVFRYKGQEPEALVIGRELGVSAVLTGRVTERGDSLVVSVALVDATDNSQMWGEQYNRRVADIFAVQEDIARQISSALRLKLSGEDEKQINKRYTESAEAYQLYLRGRFHANKRTEEGLKKAEDFFKRAIAIDPGYALAYAGLADSYALLSEYGTGAPRELRLKVKSAATKALELDDTLAEAHMPLAAAYEYDWDWARAEKEYRRAIELNPNYATAHNWYAAFLISQKRTDEAIIEITHALELDPLSLIINTSLGRAFNCARQYDRAIDQLKKTLELDPNFAEAHFQLALTYEQKRMYEEAIGEYERASSLYGDPTMAGWTGRVYALSGRNTEAERVLVELDKLARQRYVLPYIPAAIYAAMGQTDKAMEWLEKTYQERSYYMTWLLIDPIFDGMRADARFKDLLARIGFAP